MQEIDQNRRTNESGVRCRMDGRGDQWANAHRDELGNWFHMQDVDGFMGCFSFAKNTGDTLFMEYVPDDYQNRTKSIRRFGIVALFDRKRTREGALSKANVLTKAFYLHLCRLIKEHQKESPRFFFVTNEKPPWRMIELDIETGEVVCETEVNTNEWKKVWQAIGLVQLRLALQRWVEKAE